MIGVNVVLKTAITKAALAELGRFGRIRDEIPALNAVTMQARASELASIQALWIVAPASPDAERNGAPVDAVAVTDFMDGLSTWDLDAINVADYGAGRQIAGQYDGAGVIIVASAGNEGLEGMGYPGAYAPVISVAASGWGGEWTSPTWWRTDDVPDPTKPADFTADFSSREKTGQDLDVAAPGSWVVGPYQTNSGQLSYYLLGGTSMASPHVGGWWPCWLRSTRSSSPLRWR